jgi:hypothetical protein
MRIWNLNEVPTLDDVVVEELSPAKRVRRATQGKAEFRSVRVLAGVASVVLTISFSNMLVNHGSVRIPNWGSAIARSAPDLRPPLDAVFASRFDPEWTRDTEDSLLNKIVEVRLLRASQPEAIEPFLYANQQEDVTLESPRLSLDTVIKIVRRQRTS